MQKITRTASIPTFTASNSGRILWADSFFEGRKRRSFRIDRVSSQMPFSPCSRLHRPDWPTLEISPWLVIQKRTRYIDCAKWISLLVGWITFEKFIFSSCSPLLLLLKTILFFSILSDWTSVPCTQFSLGNLRVRCLIDFSPVACFRFMHMRSRSIDRLCCEFASQKKVSFLSRATRLYIPLCRSVGWSVSRLVPFLLFWRF